MNLRHLTAATLALGLCSGSAEASYERHPDLRPEQRCRDIGADSPDCQPLFWDLSAAVYVGQRASAAFDEATGYPGGMTDRPPPLWAEDRNGDGRLGPEDAALGARGFEDADAGIAAGGQNLLELCPNPAEIPWWAPVEGESNSYEIACRMGSRAYYGPFFLGSDPAAFDAVAFKVLQFENSDRVGAEGREWNTGAEIYTHVGAHHATCDVSSHACNDATDPAYANSSACEPYRVIAEQCPSESDGLGCPRAQDSHDFVVFRTTSARQGRYLMDVPDDRGFPNVEDPLWLCQSHVVNDEPSYDGFGKRNFRRQERGAVGEMVIQMFAEPWDSGRKPINTVFDFIFQRATTYIPPYTVAPQVAVWYAPFDLALASAQIHSHENMVKGTLTVLPTPQRRSGGDRLCGSAENDPNIYTSYDYFEPTVCEYWREPDGPIILRKGDAVVTECIVNNGVVHTDRIEDPELRAAVEDSVLAEEALYGRQRPETYRVRYGCEEVYGVPPGKPPNSFPVANAFGELEECPANPATEAGTGRPIDGPYAAEEFCPTGLGYTGRCAPASVIFSNTGEDAMCIPIMTYWPLDRILNADGSVNEEAADRAAAGDTDSVGTPGRLWNSKSDAGQCEDDANGPGVSEPSGESFLRPTSRNCEAGL